MSQLSFDADDNAPSHALALTAIDAVLQPMPRWLSDPLQRRDKMVAFAQAEAYAKLRSPRREAGEVAMECIHHHDRLLRFKAELLSVPQKFKASRELAAAEVQRSAEALERARSASSEAAGKHQQADRSAKAREAKLQEAHAQATQRVRDDEQALKNAVAGDNEAATDRAAAALTKSRKELDAATAARVHGSDAEVLAALRVRTAAAKVDADQAAERVTEAELAHKEARERQLQIEIDRSLVEVLDKVVGAWHSLGRVGSQALPFDPELTMHGVDEERVPLIGSGLKGLLAILHTPDYEALEVNLAELSDGNEPRAKAEDVYFDAAATAAANRGVKYYPNFEEPGPSARVIYSDPAMDSQRGIDRANG